MKKRIAKLLGAIAMLATGMASVGCPWTLSDEPNQSIIFDD